jgi:hypothetical protein
MKKVASKGQARRKHGTGKKEPSQPSTTVRSEHRSQYSNPLPLDVALIPTVSRSQKNVKLLLGARLGQFQLQRRGPFLDDSVVGFDLQAEAGLQSFELFLTRVPVREKKKWSAWVVYLAEGDL